MNETTPAPRGPEADEVAVRRLRNLLDLSVALATIPDLLGRILHATTTALHCEAFYQVADPDTRDHEGLGVGLTVARSVAIKHGGSLHGESPGLARGATFVLRLSLADELAAAARRRRNRRSGADRRA